MEQNSNNTPALSGWSKKELDLLQQVEENGARPISVSLASQMFSLFLEGYSCADIAKLNKGLTEADILYCRKKYNWDEERDTYAIQLTHQVKQKMFKQKLESVEFLTNMLSVIHKEHKEVMLKYLQTGNPDDLPKIGSLRSYKEVVETLAKITGEESTKKIKFDGTIKQDVNVKTDGSPAMTLPQELQTKLLQVLSDESEKELKGKK